MSQGDIPCSACGETGAAETSLRARQRLWLCHACDCGYIGGGETSEQSVEHYLDAVAQDGEDRGRIRSEIEEAHMRLSLNDRGARVAAILAELN